MAEFENRAVDAYKAIVSLGGRGTLTLADVEDFSTGVAQVLALMIDHEWHPADHIRKAAGVGKCIEASEGLRRMRQLRDPEHGGFTINGRKTKWDSRLWEYQLLGEGDFTDCTRRKKDRALKLKQAEDRRKMQIKIKELADACKDASKAMNALFLAGKAVAAAQERLNTAADAFTPKEQATVVDVTPEDFAIAEAAPQVVQETVATEAAPVVQAEPAPAVQVAAQQPQDQFGGMPGMPGMPAGQVAAQPQTQQPVQQGPFGGMPGMPGAQPTAQPQAQQPVQHAQQPAGATGAAGQITPDSLQREIMGAMQRTPGVMQHVNVVMMPRYCPQGGGITAIQPEHYVSFLDEMRQAEESIRQTGAAQ